MVLLSNGKGGWKNIPWAIGIGNWQLMLISKVMLFLGYSQVVNVKGENSYCQREKMGIIYICEKGVNLTNVILM